MNSIELESWKKAVSENLAMAKTVEQDRVTLVKMIKEHLESLFDCDGIRVDNDFQKIGLFWMYDRRVSIDFEKLAKLGMAFEITHDYTDDYGDGVIIVIYPFGEE